MRREMINGKEHIFHDYPKVVYLDSDKLVWKTARNAHEEQEILRGQIIAPSVKEVPDLVPFNAPTTDFEKNEVPIGTSANIPEKRKPGRPVKGN
jgi:hypothetical protein